MTATTAYTWYQYATMQRAFASLAETVRATTDASTRVARALDHQVVQHRFADAFAYAHTVCSEVKELRIYAVTTHMIRTHMYSFPFLVQQCEVLLYKPRVEDEQVPLVPDLTMAINGWSAQRQRGVIKDLRLRHYSDRPTQYVVVFDNKIALWGLYRVDNQNSTKTQAADPFVVTGDHPAGLSMIKELIVWFDTIESYEI